MSKALGLTSGEGFATMSRLSLNTINTVSQQEQLRSLSCQFRFAQAECRQLEDGVSPNGIDLPHV